MVAVSLNVFDSGKLLVLLHACMYAIFVNRLRQCCCLCCVAETSLGKHLRECGGNRTGLGFRSSTCDLMIDLLKNNKRLYFLYGQTYFLFF